MAECVYCHAETQPGDLVPELVNEHWHYFCSREHYTRFVSDGPLPQQLDLVEEVAKAEATEASAPPESPREAAGSPPQRRRRSSGKKAPAKES